MMHMADIGGMSEGSVYLPSTDMYQEGLLIPPTKLVEGGRLRHDVLRLILSNSRHGATMSLDFKGLMAANHAATDGLQKLVTRYGVETVLDVMSDLIDTSEAQLRKRLRELPDATVSSSGFMEYQPALNDVAEVQLELTKADDKLIFDFSKSSPQVPSSINCTHGGIMAGISSALFPTLAYDIAWNQGLYRTIEVVCPEGLICNARKPAPISGNISGAAYEVELASILALSRMAACSDALLGESQASSCGRPGSLGFFGVNQHGERFHGRTYDVLGSGGGAYADHDGVSAHGHHSIERTLISNVESLELDLPMIYLRRGLAPDSGGAGRHHGGMSILGVYKPHKAPSTTTRIAQKWNVPDASGAFGGFPGQVTGSELIRASDVNATLAGGHVPEFDEVHGEHIESAPDLATRTELRFDDVIRQNPPAGGGWGDPCERALEDLEIDLAGSRITRVAAERFYGCVFDADGCIDRAASEARRAHIRAERRSWRALKSRLAAPVEPLQRLLPMGDTLQISRDGTGALWTVCECGQTIAPAGDNWREYAGRHVAEPGDIGIGLVVHALLEIRQYSCGGCGRLHAVDVCRAKAPDPHDIRLAMTQAEMKGTA
jgi:N-methylhydantoinase B